MLQPSPNIKVESLYYTTNDTITTSQQAGSGSVFPLCTLWRRYTAVSPWSPHGIPMVSQYQSRSPAGDRDQPRHCTGAGMAAAGAGHLTYDGRGLTSPHHTIPPASFTLCSGSSALHLCKFRAADGNAKTPP